MRDTGVFSGVFCYSTSPLSLSLSLASSHALGPSLSFSPSFMPFSPFDAPSYLLALHNCWLPFNQSNGCMPIVDYLHVLLFDIIEKVVEALQIPTIQLN